MKKSSNILLIIGTVLLLAFSFMLPNVITGIQSGRMEAKAEQYEIEDFRISLTDQLTEGLRISGMGYTQVSLEKGENLTEQEANAKASEAVTFLKENGVDGYPDAGATDYDVQPFLVVSSDQTVTAIVWICNSVYEDGRSSTIIIDDRTGKMLSFRYTMLDATFNMVQDFSEEGLNCIAEAAARYYGFTLTDVKRLERTDMDREGYAEYFSVLAVLKDENEKEISLPISSEYGLVSFNFVNQNYRSSIRE